MKESQAATRLSWRRQYLQGCRSWVGCIKETTKKWTPLSFWQKFKKQILELKQAKIIVQLTKGYNDVRWNQIEHY